MDQMAAERQRSRIAGSIVGFLRLTPDRNSKNEKTPKKPVLSAQARLLVLV